MDTYLLFVILIPLLFGIAAVVLHKQYGKQWFKRHKKAFASAVAITIIASGMGILLLPRVILEGDDDANIVWYTSSGRNAFFKTNTSLCREKLRSR